MARTQRKVDPSGRYTWADYQTWPDRPRYELTGATEVGVLPGLSIDWTPLAQWLPPLEEDGRGPL